MAKIFLVKEKDMTVNQMYARPKVELSADEIELLKGGLNNWIGEMAISDSDMPKQRELLKKLESI